MIIDFSLSFKKNWNVLEELESTKDGPELLYHNEDNLWVAGVTKGYHPDVMDAGIVKSSLKKSNDDDIIQILSGEI